MLKNRRIRVRPGEPVPVPLSDEEFQTLLDQAIAPPDLEEALRFRVVEDGRPVAKLTLEDVDELAGYVAFAANHACDKKYQRLMSSIYDKLAGVLETYTDEEENVQSASKIEETPIEMVIMQFLTGKLAVEELSEKEAWDLAERVRRYINECASPELGGLSPNQAHALIGADWDDPDGAIGFHPHFDEEQLRQFPLWVNSRIFLQSLHEEKEWRATAGGNLSRSCVAQLMDKLEIPEHHLRIIREYSKVVNEQDVMWVHWVRLLLQLGGLIRRSKKVFRLTGKGKRILMNDDGNGLYMLLFKTCFRKFNLAYFDRLVDSPAFQPTIGYALYRVSKVLRGWRQINFRTACEIVAPIVVETIPAPYQESHLPWMVEGRILRPLRALGLLRERLRQAKEPDGPFRQYQKSPLFDKFLEFRIESAPPPGRA